MLIAGALALLAGGASAVGGCHQDNHQQVRMLACTAILKSGLAFGPFRAWALNSRGLGRYETRLIVPAIDDFQASIALDPNARTYNNLANAYRLIGQLQQAAQHYSLAIAQRPPYERAYVNRAMIYAALGEHDKALKDAEAAVARQPRNATPLTVRGNAKLALGDTEGALLDQDKAIELRPDFDVPYNNRGCVSLALGQPLRAVDDFNTAINIAVDGIETSARATALFNRAAAETALGQLPQAAASLAQARDLDPDVERRLNFQIVTCGSTSLAGATPRPPSR